jgi:streptomycin 6-kinase
VARVELPVPVRQRAAHLGPAGEAWLSGLPGLVADLERRWSVTVGAPLPGGTAAFVARARTADGRDVVVKVDPPDPDVNTAGQVRTLEAARGQGYALLLAHDVEHRALLLEALGTPLSRLDLPPERQMEVLCALLVRAWQVPRPDSATQRDAQDKAVGLARLVSSLWEDLGRPCSERVLALALTYAERRRAATDVERAVVVHGDPHPDNALRVPAPRPGAEAGFVFVDPDGFLADPAYDLGVVLRGWCGEILDGDATGTARRYCRLLAHESGVAETAIWEWGFLERVSTGLYLLRFGADRLGRRYLQAAERLAVPAHR